MEHIACVRYLQNMWCQSGVTSYISTFAHSEGIRIDLSVGCCGFLITPQNPQEFLAQFQMIKNGASPVAPGYQYSYTVPQMSVQGDVQQPLLAPQESVGISFNQQTGQPMYYYQPTFVPQGTQNVWKKVTEIIFLWSISSLIFTDLLFIYLQFMISCVFLQQ